MTVRDFSTEQRARMVNGDVVRYDRLEEHGEHRIFYRGKIGIVYAAYKDSVITYNENQNEQAAKHDSSNSTHPQGGRAT